MSTTHWQRDYNTAMRELNDEFPGCECEQVESRGSETVLMRDRSNEERLAIWLVHAAGWILMVASVVWSLVVD